MVGKAASPVAAGDTPEFSVGALVLLPSLVVLNAICVELGYLCYLTSDNVASMWPASGLLLAAYFRLPLRRWPVVFIGGVLGQLLVEVALHDRALGWGLAFGVNNAVEGLLGAGIMRAVVNRRTPLDSLPPVLALLAAATIAPIPAASAGAWIITQLYPTVDANAVWHVWHASDFAGIILVAPPVLAWSDGRPIRDLELAITNRAVPWLLMLATFLVGLVSVGPLSLDTRSFLDHPYVAFPLLTWIAVRLGPRAASLGALFVGAAAIAAARVGRGPFVTDLAPGISQVIELQSFASVLSLTALTAAAIAVAHDRAQERQRIAEAELVEAQKLEAIGLLAGGVAHDFNNLLTAILGNAELAREIVTSAEADPVEVAEILGNIDSAGARGKAMIDKLLAFSERRSVAAEPVDLNERIRCLLPLLPSLDFRNIEVQTALHPGGAFALASVGDIDQILLNLAVNARDALRSGGQLTLSTRAEGDEVVLEVGDSGTGMAPDVLARVFEPFYTTKGPGTGTGLGLASVQRLMQNHGGRVTISSEVDRGTTAECRWARCNPRPGQALTAGT